MGEKTLSLSQQEELDLRIAFLHEVFRILFEVRTLETLTLDNFDTILLDSCNKLDEIKAIMDGKDIIPRNENSVFGMN